jgi:hypothetical protein
MPMSSSYPDVGINRPIPTSRLCRFFGGVSVETSVLVVISVSALLIWSAY